MFLFVNIISTVNVSVPRKSCLFPVSFFLSPESPLVPVKLEFYCVKEANYTNMSSGEVHCPLE